jgi:hypothetical protein
VSILLQKYGIKNGEKPQVSQSLPVGGYAPQLKEKVGKKIISFLSFSFRVCHWFWVSVWIWNQKVGTSTVRFIVYNHIIFVGFFPLPLASKVGIMIICSPFFSNSFCREFLVSTW